MSSPASSGWLRVTATELDEWALGHQIRIRAAGGADVRGVLDGLGLYGEGLIAVRLAGPAPGALGTHVLAADTELELWA